MKKAMATCLRLGAVGPLAKEVFVDTTYSVCVVWSKSILYCMRCAHFPSFSIQIHWADTTLHTCACNWKHIFDSRSRNNAVHAVAAGNCLYSKREHKHTVGIEATLRLGRRNYCLVNGNDTFVGRVFRKYVGRFEVWFFASLNNNNNCNINQWGFLRYICIMILVLYVRHSARSKYKSLFCCCCVF